MKPIDRANHDGVFWKDINWSNPIHVMNECTCCGIDSGEAVGMGHQASCYYGNGNELAGAEVFFAGEIQEALTRERNYV